MSSNDSITLHAGPINLTFTDGELRYLCIGAREILRRVYVAVRDRWWNTIPLALTDLQIHCVADQFELSFTATHQQGEIDFAWRGAISGATDGTITFTMNGAARSTFWHNRIGLCVLHPPNEAACEIEHTDGTRTMGCFPRLIAPHQPFKDIRAVSHTAAPGLRAEVRLTGDTCEMEDQRNWTDGSFETYSTPLALPFPVEITADVRVQQSFSLRLLGNANAATKPQPLTLTIAENAIGKLPRLGLGLASHGAPLSESATELLRALRLAHLRLDLCMRGAWQAELARATNEAITLQTQLEVAVFLSDDAANELAVLRAALNELHPPVARWLIFHEAEAVTAPGWVGQARVVLRDYDATAAFGAGTNQYFAELNRELFSKPRINYPADVLCYSANPQVHGFDKATLIESLSAQADTVFTARHAMPETPVAVSPVTLKPRFNQHSASEKTSDIHRPNNVDARQASLFAACWTLGSLKYLAESGAASVTYFETTGWRGVIEAEGVTPAFSAYGEPYPLYHLFAALGGWLQAEVLPVTSTDALRVVGLALRKGKRSSLWLANLSNRLELVWLRGSSGMWNGRSLTATGWQASSAAVAEGRLGDRLEITLLPNEILWLYDQL
ncbi:MAG: hypothetical protein HOP19_25735 [Acidobacteria bacterium]|nr:hypothetical protein [Acidobacteriota bacterium]